MSIAPTSLVTVALSTYFKWSLGGIGERGGLVWWKAFLPKVYWFIIGVKWATQNARTVVPLQQVPTNTNDVTTTTTGASRSQPDTIVVTTTNCVWLECCHYCMCAVSCWFHPVDESLKLSEKYPSTTPTSSPTDSIFKLLLFHYINDNFTFYITKS